VGMGRWGKNKCAANVCRFMCVGFAALLFLRSVGLNFHVGWFWCLLNLRTVAHSMTYNVEQIAEVAR